MFEDILQRLNSQVICKVDLLRKSSNFVLTIHIVSGLISLVIFRNNFFFETYIYDCFKESNQWRNSQFPFKNFKIRLIILKFNQNFTKQNLKNLAYYTKDCLLRKYELHEWFYFYDQFRVIKGPTITAKQICTQMKNSQNIQSCTFKNDNLEITLQNKLLSCCIKSLTIFVFSFFISLNLLIPWSFFLFPPNICLLDRPFFF